MRIKLLTIVETAARNPRDRRCPQVALWSRQGSGKRGGARVIYFYHHEDAPLYLLLAYAKAQREDMTPKEKRAAAALAAALKAQAAVKRTKR